MKKRTLVPWNVVARLVILGLVLAFIANVSAQTTDKAFLTVDVPAQFPGGKPAWQQYLKRNQKPDVLVSKGARTGTYKVNVSFIVDERGNLSDVHALNDPGFGAKAEAERLIKKGPNWVPAVQNGKKVKYRHKQEITFQIPA
jgi:protein TonB